MEIIKYFTRISSLILVGISIVFFSCETNQRASENTDTPATEGTADDFEGTEPDIETRRERLADYMQNQTTRMQSELDSLRQELKTASAEEKNQIENQIKRLEADIDNLEQQQTNLAQANLEGLEQIERVINEWLETQQLDRSVRGEGTSLDGPELNRTGTRTGTEVESQVPLELEDENTQSTAVPPGP